LNSFPDTIRLKDERVKIAVLTSSYPRYPGDGTAPFVRSISEHLAKLGHDVEIVAPYDPAVTTMDHRVKVHRFRYIWPRGWHIMGHARSLERDTRLRPLSIFLLPFFLVAEFIKLMGVTKVQKSEVIHAHWVIPNGLVAAWVAGICKIPFIVSLHGSDIFVARRNRIFGTVARWVFRRASGVTACSRELQQAAIALGAPEDTRLLAWGADPLVFSPERRSMEKSYAASAGKPEVIFAALGRLVYKKGFGNLIAAMPRVVKECPGARLILGGDGLLLDEFQRQTEKLGVSDHVTFAGRIPWDEAPLFLANADIFVLPSVQDQYGNVDGLPTVLLEAMSSGLAVIACDIGGVNLVLQDGKNGCLIPPGDVQALADAMLELARNPKRRQELGRTARMSVVDQFNWDNVATQIAEMLAEAIKDNRT
jgi:glycosyltransferase involved in cell wall biosynthesis